MLTFAQITDTHIYAGGEAWDEVRGVDPCAHLARAVEDLNTLEPQPAFVVHTGDIGGLEGTADDYERFLPLIEPLRAPIHYIPGNHDINPSALNTMLVGRMPESPVHWHFDEQGWAFVGIDSSSGAVDEGELYWLNQTLTSQRSSPTVLFLHHHPFPIGVPGIDKLVLRNALELLNLLADHPQVRLVVFGHVHSNGVFLFNDRIFLSTPAIGWQFVVRMDPARPGELQDFRPPAYRLVTLHDDGRIETWLRRLADDGVYEEDRRTFDMEETKK